ncbi:complement factor B-like [Gastrophryne carolinensis]
MLPLLLLSTIAVCNAAPASHCDVRKLTIKGGSIGVNPETGQAMFSCPPGKYPHPGPTRDCFWSGRWNSEEKAECRDFECPKIAKFDNGEYYPRKNRYYVGDVVHFECHGGFELKYGNETRTCQENGKWSGKTRVCEDNDGHCPDPGIPIGSTKVGHFYRIDSKVTYECQYGLKMFGSKERVCREDKTWSGSEPSCRSWYTYDKPDEVAAAFGANLAEAIESSDPNRVEEKGDRKLQVKAGGPMNIFIIIDASKSVDEENFNTAKQIATTFIDKISTYDFTPRYSVLTFASNTIKIITLSDEENTDPEKVIKRIEDFKYDEHGDKQGTNTRGALAEVLNQLSLDLERKKAAFYDASNIILLMTDGKHNMGGDPRVEVDRIRYMLKINEATEHKLDIYVFGLGDEISQEEINDIASKKKDETHVFQMQSVDDLKVAFDSIIDETEAFEMCGISKEYSEKGAEKYPWIVNIKITRPEGVENCKGSVISKNFILTAAHCFQLKDMPHVVTVDLQIDDKKHTEKVKNIYRHPSYDPIGKQDKNIKRSYDFDFALLELMDKLSFSATLRPICLPCTTGASWAMKLRGQNPKCDDHKNLLLNGEFVKSMFVTEDGKPEKQVKADNYVQKDVTIKLGSKRLDCLDDAKKADELKDIADIRDMVTDNFLCTGGTQPEVEPQTCKGDSGGPLIIQYKNRFIQVGVISWGTTISCNGFKRGKVPNNARDFQADVFAALDWIKSIDTGDLIYID